MVRPNVIRGQPIGRELGTQLVKIERDYQIRNVSTDIRVAKQQTTASPVTAEAIGSGSASLVG
jgi:hypothetical protein